MSTVRVDKSRPCQCHFTFIYTIFKYWSIVKVLLLMHSVVNLQQNAGHVPSPLFRRFYRKARYCDCMSSVCLSVCPSVRLWRWVNCDHVGWNSSKIISPLVSLGCSLFATPTWRVCSKGNTPKFGPKVTHPLLIWASETFDRKLRPNGYR